MWSSVEDALLVHMLYEMRGFCLDTSERIDPNNPNAELIELRGVLLNIIRRLEKDYAALSHLVAKGQGDNSA